MYESNTINPNKSCDPIEIIELNNTKEYTLLSTALLEAVLTNNALNAQSSKLWQLLYNKARFNDNLETCLSYRELSILLGKSTRTIARYMKILVTEGFLNIRENFSDHGSRLENTFYISIPESLAKSIKKNKDRVTSPLLKENKTPDKIVISPSDKNGVTYNNIYKYNTNNINVVNFNFLNNESKVLENTTSTQSKQTTAHLFHTEQINKKIVKSSENATVSSERALNTYENSRLSENERKGLKENNNKRQGEELAEIHESRPMEADNTSNTQMFEESIVQKEKTIKKIEDTLEKLETTPEPKNNIAKFERMRKISELKTIIEMEASRAEEIKEQIEIDKRQKVKMDQLNEDELFMLHKEGDRAFSQFEFNRLRKGLVMLGIVDSNLSRLINEIVYAIRFGNLRKQQSTSSLLSIQHAISISIKLVRESRWETPRAFLEMV